MFISEMLAWVCMCDKHLHLFFIYSFSPRKLGSMFLPALVCLCVCVCVCLSMTTITKKIVDGFVPNFM